MDTLGSEQVAERAGVTVRQVDGAASRVVRGQDLAPGVIVTVVEDDV